MLDRTGELAQSCSRMIYPESAAPRFAVFQSWGGWPALCFFRNHSY